MNALDEFAVLPDRTQYELLRIARMARQMTPQERAVAIGLMTVVTTELALDLAPAVDVAIPGAECISAVSVVLACATTQEAALTAEEGA